MVKNDVYDFPKVFSWRHEARQVPWENTCRSRFTPNRSWPSTLTTRIWTGQRCCWRRLGQNTKIQKRKTNGWIVIYRSSHIYRQTNKQTSNQIVMKYIELPKKYRTDNGPDNYKRSTDYMPPPLCDFLWLKSQAVKPIRIHPRYVRIFEGLPSNHVNQLANASCSNHMDQLGVRLTMRKNTWTDWPTTHEEKHDVQQPKWG